MVLRSFLYEATACASYLFGCLTHRSLAVVDPHAELVESYLEEAERLGAPVWWAIVAANVLLGLNQGFAWSMTVVMKIDLVGPRRRGLALGLNESAGYVGVAATALATGALAATYAPRTLVWTGAAVIAALGTTVSLLFVRDTGAHVDEEQRRQGAVERSSWVSAFIRGSVG